MRAQQHIATLTAALRRTGEPITIRRGPHEATVQALVRGKDAKAVVGTTTTVGWHITIAPTGLDPLGFVVKVNDEVVVKGRSCRIDSAYPIHVGTELVRLDLTAAG